MAHAGASPPMWNSDVSCSSFGLRPRLQSMSGSSDFDRYAPMPSPGLLLSPSSLHLPSGHLQQRSQTPAYSLWPVQESNHVLPKRPVGFERSQPGPQDLLMVQTQQPQRCGFGPQGSHGGAQQRSLLGEVPSLLGESLLGEVPSLLGEVPQAHGAHGGARPKTSLLGEVPQGGSSHWETNVAWLISNTTLDNPMARLYSPQSANRRRSNKHVQGRPILGAPVEQPVAPPVRANHNARPRPSSTYTRPYSSEARAAAAIRRRDEAAIARSRNNTICKFCQKNGEMPEFYTTHRVKDCWGRVVCPVLRVYVCPVCNATGDDAHTIYYCPSRKA